MKKIFCIILFAVFAASLLVGCRDNQERETYSPEEELEKLAGIDKDEDFVEGALTVAVCGAMTVNVEAAAAEYSLKYDEHVNLVYYGDGEWDKLVTKILAQDDDIDLFLPVSYHTASLVGARVYEDLSGYEELKSRIEGNALALTLAKIDSGELIGVPCNTQAYSTENYEVAATLMKYCYKNLDMSAWEYSDPDGEELFEVFKHLYEYPDDPLSSPYYDFDYSAVETQYLFMNKFSVRKDQAANFLCILFDLQNGELELSEVLYFPYCEIDETKEYKPSWVFYPYEYVQVLGDAWQLALESDGSDEALRKIAEDGAKDLEMRLMG